MKNKAFTLIEVLIATLILSISILIVSTALKQFFYYKERLHKYQLIYITTLSLIDKISTQDLLKKSSSYGKLNGLKYKYKATVIERKSNLLDSGEFEDQVRTGNFEIILLKVELWVDDKKFEFFKTQYKKSLSFTTL